MFYKGVIVISKLKIVIVIGLVLVICVITFNVANRHSINKTITGVEYRIGDANYSQNVSISLSGIYTKWPQTFDGEITIKKDDIILEYDTGRLEFFDGFAEIRTYGESVNYPSLLISCTSTFDTFLILVNGMTVDSLGIKKIWNDTNGIFIVVPAHNREQSLEIAKSLYKKSKEIIVIEWD